MTHFFISGAGTSERFDFRTGGKQGGVERPDEWNMFIEFILEPLVKSWHDRKFGFRLLGWDAGFTH